MSSLLDVRNLQMSYGGIQAVKGIDFQVNSGEVVALVGANGAGKTTTLKAIAGMLSAAPASITFNGAQIGGTPPHRLVRQGLVLVPEGRGIFPKLTVTENLAMGAYVRHDPEVGSDMDRVFSLLPRLKERAFQTGGTLSGGEQQMLAIGRAIMTRPRLLLLDEPSMGLAPLIIRRIFETIQEIAQSGVTILLVEQNARLALESTQRAYVMESGLITMAGASKELLHDPKVRAAYLGE